MQAIRRHIILFLIGMFFLMMLAVGLLVLPIALVLCLPWSTTVKVSVIAGLGAVYITLPAVALSWVLSEKRWMRFTMAEEWLSKVTDGS